MNQDESKSYNEIFGDIHEERDSVSDYIGALLKRAGEYFNYSYIVVKRVTPSEKTMYCSNQWSSSKDYILLNVEARFLDCIWDKLKNKYTDSANGCYIYYEGDDSTCLRIADVNSLVSMVSVPVFAGDELCGCIDFADCFAKRIFSENEINVLKELTADVFSIISDSEKSIKKDIKTKYKAGYDPITFLPKYEVMAKHVYAYVAKSKDCKLIVTCSDFSNFKFINEKYGYNVGNEILHKFAVNIYSECSFIVGACRSHSDNFITVSRLDENVSDADILEYTKAIGRAFTDAISKYYFDANLVMNMGIAEMPLDPEAFESTVTKANIARKLSKQEKSEQGVRCLIFEQKMQDDIHKAADYVSEFNNALNNNEFKVLVQPIVDTENMMVTGGEALIRWVRQDGSVIYPEEFVDAFEKDGCITRLDYFVCEEIFKFLYNRHSQGMLIHSISINLSYLHKDDPKFISFIKRLSSRYPFPPEYVIFEFHESIYTDNSPASRDLLNNLSNMNYGILIDRFGTGYSSLNAMTRFKITGIKLDKAFMKRNMDDKTKIILRSIIKMARELNLICSCTGIETEEQRKFARESGCIVMQGYYYSKALELQDFAKLLNTSF